MDNYTTIAGCRYIPHSTYGKWRTEEHRIKDVDDLETDVWELRRRCAELRCNYRESEARMERLLEMSRKMRRENTLMCDRLAENEATIKRIKDRNCIIEAENDRLWAALREANNCQMASVRDSLDTLKRTFCRY